MFWVRAHGRVAAPPPARPPDPPVFSYADDGATPTENSAVSYEPTVTAGATPINYTLAPSSDPLPDGLSLASATGIVSGTLGTLAFEEGPTYNLVIRGTNAGGYFDATLSLTAVNVVSVAGAAVAFLPGVSDGEYRLQFVAPTPPGAETIDHYEVAHGFLHITPDNVDAQDVETVPAVAAPGATETLTCDWLEEAEIEQAAVRAVWSGGGKGAWLMAGWGVDCLSAGYNIPAMVSPTTISSLPYTCAAPGDYKLSGNLSSTGHGITVAAGGVRIFLEDHTLTYGTGNGNNVYGIFRQYGGVEVYGARAGTPGKIIHGGTGTGCHACYVNEGGFVGRAFDVEVDSLDSEGISITVNIYASVHISYCRVNLTHGDITNRFAGIGAIRCQGSSSPVTGGVFHIHNNTVPDAPFNCIKVSGGLDGRGIDTPTYIHHNKVAGTRTRANCYAIATAANYTYIWDNLIEGPGRGLYLEGDRVQSVGDAQYCWAHDNRVDIDNHHDQAPDFSTWNHGIKIEESKHAQVTRNFVTVHTHGQIGEAAQETRVLDCGMSTSETVRIWQNCLEGIADDTDQLGLGCSLSDNPNPAIGNWLYGNVFRATDVFFKHFWDNYADRVGAIVGHNRYVRDTTNGAGSTGFCHFSTNPEFSDDETSFLDPTFAEAPTGAMVFNQNNSGAYGWSVRRTIRVQTGVGVTVTVRNKNNVVEWTAVSDADGIAEGPVVSKIITAPVTPPFIPGIVEDMGPFEITAGAYTGDHTIGNGPLVVDVDDIGGTASENTDAPDAPTSVLAAARTATAALLLWNEPASTTGIHHYEISVGGSVRALAYVPNISIFGLNPGTEYAGNIAVVAVGNNGVESDPLVLPTFTTQAETRGAF